MSALTPAAVVGISLFSYFLMAVIAMATAGLIAALVAGLARLERRAATAAAVPPAEAPAFAPSIAPGLDPAVVAVIAAAVQSVAGGHRIVWIGETASAGGWTGEVRQRHHGSHQPRHDH